MEKGWPGAVGQRAGLPNEVVLCKWLDGKSGEQWVTALAERDPPPPSIRRPPTDLGMGLDTPRL